MKYCCRWSPVLNKVNRIFEKVLNIIHINIKHINRTKIKIMSEDANSLSRIFDCILIYLNIVNPKQKTDVTSF